MKQEIEKALKSLVNYINQDLDSDCMVVGSLALETCGFPMCRECHDIDIEVKSTDKVKAAFTALAKATNPDGTYSGECHRIDFKWMDIKVNAWLIPELNKQHIWKDYIKYATVKEVLKVKLKYGRSKDMKDLGFALKELFSFINY